MYKNTVYRVSCRIVSLSHTVFFLYSLSQRLFVFFPGFNAEPKYCVGKPMEHWQESTIEIEGD